MWLLLGAAVLVLLVFLAGLARAAGREMPKPPGSDRGA